MAAVTVSQVRTIGQVPQFRGRALLIKVTHTASYATGGEDLPLSVLRGMKAVDAVCAVSGFAASKWKGKTINTATLGGGVKLAGTRTAPKLQLFIGSASPAEVANAANMSTTTYDLLVIGR
jgi:hypothetical protein